MTTNIGKHCTAANLLVEKLRVTNTAIFPGVTHGTGSHEHQVSSNGSVVYFKYAMRLPIEKLSVTNGSSKCKITFDNAHHFDGTVTGLKMTLSLATISPMTHAGGDHSLTVADFIGKRDIDTWSNALSNDELEFDLATNSSSTGEITITGGVGTVLIYKYLDWRGQV